MNNFESIMKVRNTDYLEWQVKIQQLEKENVELKANLEAAQRTRDKVFDDIIDLKSQLDNYQKIKAKDIVEILEKYFGEGQFNNFIVTTEYKKYDLVANDIIELMKKGLE